MATPFLWWMRNEASSTSPDGIWRTWTESNPGEFRVTRANFNSVYNKWPTNGSHIFTLESDSSAFRMLLNGAVMTNNAPDYDSGLNMNWTIGNRVAWPGNDAQFPAAVEHYRALMAAEPILGPRT